MSDTFLTPWESGSYGSRVTFLGGNACRRAVGDAKFKLLSHWAEEWGCKPSDITMKDHRVFVKGDAEKNISYNEACYGYEEKKRHYDTGKKSDSSKTRNISNMHLSVI